MKSINKLKLYETMEAPYTVSLQDYEAKYGLAITRVPGGWIYIWRDQLVNMDAHREVHASVFVPYSEEFMDK